jgi:beta-lactamase regulating signal transducer with metallopeptidase domain
MIPIDSLLAAIGHTLWAVSWRVTVLIAFIGILALFFRKSSSSFRYFLWCIVIVRLCIPLNLKLPFGSPNVISALNNIAFQTPENVNVLSPVYGQSQAINAIGTSEIIPHIWLAILSLILFLVIARFLQIRKMIAFCSPVTRPDLCDLFQRILQELGIKKSVRLLSIDEDTIQAPSVTGVFRPVILLPQKITKSWSCEDLEPVFLHELIHIRHYDPLFNFLQMILQAVFFFHPLVWYANWKIRKIREEVCDDFSIRCLKNDRKQYSLSFLRIMEESLREPVWGWGGIGFSEKRSNIKERIGRIMDTHYLPWKPMTIGSIVLLGGIVIIGLALSCDKKADNITSISPADKTTVQPQRNSSFDVEVYLLKNGGYKVNGIPTISSDLEKVIKSELYKTSEQNVIFRSDAKPLFEDLTKVMDIAKKAGAKGMAFPTDNPLGEVIKEHAKKPTKQMSLQTKDQYDITITILGNGMYQVNDIQVKDSELENILKKEIGNSSKKMVLLKGNSDVAKRDIDFAIKTAGKNGAKGTDLNPGLGKKLGGNGALTIRRPRDTKINESMEDWGKRNNF